MKKILIAILSIAALTSCRKDKEPLLPTPNSVTNITAEPRVGAVLIKWTRPATTSYDYLEISYDRNGQKRIINASSFADSILVPGLLHKINYTFTVQAVNRSSTQEVKSGAQTVGPVTPIRREVVVSYFDDRLTKLNVTADMLDTYTQEQSEGPKSNLVDGNINTYWHTAWSSGTAPLPHWIQINASEPMTLGLIKYWFRQNNGDVPGRPTQIQLQTSEDGASWNTVFESGTLATDNPTAAKILSFKKNYTSKFFRVVISKNGGKSYTHLGEIEFYTMAQEEVDLEKKAEDEYGYAWN